MEKLKTNTLMVSLWLGLTSIWTFVLPFPFNILSYLISLFNTSVLTVNLIALYLGKKEVKRSENKD